MEPSYQLLHGTGDWTGAGPGKIGPESQAATNLKYHSAQPLLLPRRWQRTFAKFAVLLSRGRLLILGCHIKDHKIRGGKDSESRLSVVILVLK